MPCVREVNATARWNVRGIEEDMTSVIVFDSFFFSFFLFRFLMRARTEGAGSQVHKRSSEQERVQNTLSLSLEKARATSLFTFSRASRLKSIESLGAELEARGETPEKGREKAASCEFFFFFRLQRWRRRRRGPRVPRSSSLLSSSRFRVPAAASAAEARAPRSLLRCQRPLRRHPFSKR